MDSNIPPIIVKKKKSEGHHGGAWKVAYADFVTAMMALFIVLWVLGQDDATKESVAKYFKDPIGFTDKTRNILDGKGKSVVPPEIEKLMQRKQEEEVLRNMGNQILNELADNPEFGNLMDQIKIEIVDEGLRIELAEDSSNVFFEIGTATLKHDAELLLEKIGDHLAKLPNKIVIEGHTDSRKYNNSDGFNNFDLSTERANSARRALLKSELKESQIYEVRGYADRKLRNKADPYSAVNRRISIIVRFSNEQ